MLATAKYPAHFGGSGEKRSHAVRYLFRFIDDPRKKGLQWRGLNIVDGLKDMDESISQSGRHGVRTLQ
jgi:hypothetical protein